MDNSSPNIAFAFDIDGVLIKGTKPLPGARETLQKLQDSKIPFIFLTNSGGHTEEAHVAKLGLRLGLTFDTRQFIQSHTPYLDLVPEYRDKTILVLGGHGTQIQELAAAYGFQKAITTSDVFLECEHIHPFPEMTRAHHEEHGRLCDARGHDALGATEVAAILVWSSPRDWCLDLQVVADLLLSVGGLIGTRSLKNGDGSLPNHGYQRDGQPRLFFCNPDLEWATQHAQPRLAQGAFRHALKGVWREVTKGRAELEYTICGKPTDSTYKYAEKTLLRYNDHLANVNGTERKIETVFMVGDNPESDIAGANSFNSPSGLEWRSVLVETGVYAPGTEPVHKPKHIAGDVRKAVGWALSQADVDWNSPGGIYISGCSV
ncbi:hypothetical protein DL764_010820 [Monosporascus ibericus]|uniref:HAD-superfamily subfamily IIA hydrolase n=1 Tax=Monosporascus ibericus TaxID=155417 RepID=A0A4Q4SU03_9PEZI|nr:hypothetical protein DL764_010820 [Monosporascus ibericus]